MSSEFRIYSLYALPEREVKQTRKVLSNGPAADADSRVVEVKLYLDEETSDRLSRLTNSKAIVKIIGSN
ncbi:hypothetical protein I4641_00535 [Waterburya agarophytonicola K14]|uniref:Uncharacterized protein n=1 Tax=Waterburya agarophytonicola KI4 TaxID=2874699 RepID=A0A964FE52_9CYAN|nr:hypothetical protein [Waterburya agarophytonicola]MCC0175467.1 hypothetical protein [Waterburya agarophytonicola KI4]